MSGNLAATRLSRSDAAALDRDDPLAGLRAAFTLPAGGIYLDGNSLGPASHAAEASLRRIHPEWRRYRVGGWTRGKAPWMALSERLGAAMAPLVGARADEVIATGSTTVNLHRMVATFFAPTRRRRRILATALDFPSDIHVLRSHLALHGLDPDNDLVLVGSRDRNTVAERDIAAAMTDDVALAVLPTVLYRSGQLLDVGSLARLARGRGIVLGVDAAHSIGTIPHQFAADDVDFAMWCGYKYLNGGPGAVGGLFVHRRHLGTRPGIAGWFGATAAGRLAMDLTLRPPETAGAYQTGIPHVFSLAPLLGALATVRTAGIHRIRSKSLRLTGFLMELADNRLAVHGAAVVTPRAPQRRGGHVALTHPDAEHLVDALAHRGIVVDHRPPDIVRLAPCALYTRFVDVWDAVEALRDVCTGQRAEAT